MATIELKTSVNSETHKRIEKRIKRLQCEIDMLSFIKKTSEFLNLNGIENEVSEFKDWDNDGYETYFSRLDVYPENMEKYNSTNKLLKEFLNKKRLEKSIDGTVFTDEKTDSCIRVYLPEEE